MCRIRVMCPDRPIPFGTKRPPRVKAESCGNSKYLHGEKPTIFCESWKIEDWHTNVSESSSDSWTLVKLVNLLHLHCSKLSAGNLASARELGSLQAVQVQYLDWRFLGNVRWCDVMYEVGSSKFGEVKKGCIYACNCLYSTRLDLWSMS